MDKNKTLFKRANKVIPGGVNSPVRAFKAVGGAPIFIKKASGVTLTDSEGKRYLDFCASWGPMFFGHAPAGLIREVSRALKDGTSFGVSTEKEVCLAEKVTRFFPVIEKVRLVSSGTEAVMSAVRLARGFTGRKKILKVEGGYHGHVDSLLVRAGSGVASFGVPDSAGIPDELARLTLTIPFNDTEALETVFRKEGKNIAAFIVEPVPANMGVIPPEGGFLERSRELTQKYGALLIFDEVITGFRLSRGGAGKVFRIKPDLTTLGKIIGGGFPLAAFGGRKEIMNTLAPEGPVYQAGTLSGNPVAVTAALWMLETMERTRPHKALQRKSDEFFQDFEHMIGRGHFPVTLNTMGSMFTLFMNEGPVTDFKTAAASDTKKFAAFFQGLLKEGIYTAPSQFEANFISTAHSTKDLQKYLKTAEKVLKRIF